MKYYCHCYFVYTKEEHLLGQGERGERKPQQNAGTPPLAYTFRLLCSLTSVKAMSFRSLDGLLMWIVGNAALGVPRFNKYVAKWNGEGAVPYILNKVFNVILSELSDK